MLRKILTIAWKEVYLTFTDRNLLLIMILAPLAISAIVGMAFGGASGGSPAIGNTRSPSSIWTPAPSSRARPSTTGPSSPACSSPPRRRATLPAARPAPSATTARWSRTNRPRPTARTPPASRGLAVQRRHADRHRRRARRRGTRRICRPDRHPGRLQRPALPGHRLRGDGQLRAGRADFGRNLRQRRRAGFGLDRAQRRGRLRRPARRRQYRHLSLDQRPDRHQPAGRARP